jgi:beta-galactosidase
MDNVSELMVAHLWQVEILNHTADPVGMDGDRITAVRNRYGKGEVLWIPMELGLGAWLGKNGPLSELLSNETALIRKETPVTFRQKTDNVIMQLLKNGNTYVSVITNGADKVKEVSLQLNRKLSPEIIFNSSGENIIINPSKINLSSRQTIVVKWINSD